MEELQKDLEAVENLLSICTRDNVRDVLIKLKAETERKLSVLELKSRIAEGKIMPPSKQNRYLVELTEYAWDQSDKLVKLFVTLDGVQNIEECNVVVEFTDHSLKLLVRDLNNKDYALQVNNLLWPMDVDKSYRKVKTGLVAIYMAKRDHGKKWSHLTSIEKRLKDKQDEEINTEGDPPEDALVSIMKKMYNTGDSKTKQMIAKAWTESQEKARSEMPDMPKFPRNELDNELNN